MNNLTALETARVCDPNLQLRLGEAETEQFATLFKALGNPVRLQIIDLISQGNGQICGCDLERHIHLTQPTISHHLKVLRDAGIITSDTHSVWTFHRINLSMLTALQGLLMMVNNTGR